MRVFAKKRLAQGVKCVPDEPVAGGDAIHSGVDGATRLEAEHAGQLERVVPNEAFD